MRSVDSTMPPRTGTAAPVVLVPRPRAVSATRRSRQKRTRSRTCSGARANTTASGGWWRRLLSAP